MLSFESGVRLVPPHLRRPLTVVAGLYLVGLPTAYTVFAEEWGGRAESLRIALGLLWLLLALILGAVAARRDDTLDEMARRTLEQRGEIGRELFVTVEYAIKALLDQRSRGELNFRAFVPDEHGALAPIYESPARWQRWAVNQGVVGTVWHRGEMLHLSGEHLQDPLMNLSEDQARHYADLMFVAAAPIVDAEDRRIGVIAASSRSDQPWPGQVQGELLALGLYLGQLLSLVSASTTASGSLTWR